MTKATMDSHQIKLALNANIARHENEAWATEAIKKGRGWLHSHNQRGGGSPGYPCLHLGKIPQGKHARVGTWGDIRGRVGSLSIPEGLWGGLVGLST